MAAEGADLYCKSTPVAEGFYEQDEDNTVAWTVVSTLAEASNTDPVELPPLYDFIDPTMLDKVFKPPRTGNPTEVVLTFRYRDLRVFLRGDGYIRVFDGERTDTPTEVF